MDSKTYIANALRTESVPASLEINQTVLHATLEVAVTAANVLDLVKRRLFYGTPLAADKLLPQLGFLANMVQFLGATVESGEVDLNAALDQAGVEALQLPPEIAGMSLANINPRLLHAAVGCFTESGELLESVKRQYETGELDKVNFGEEVGDIEWYQAIGFDETGVTEAHCREKNIAKLRKRYPEKFDAVAAQHENRDLAAERRVLEGEASNEATQAAA